jgi:hypothetical protein
MVMKLHTWLYRFVVSQALAFNHGLSQYTKAWLNQAKDACGLAVFFVMVIRVPQTSNL